VHGLAKVRRWSARVDRTAGSSFTHARDWGGQRDQLVYGNAVKKNMNNKRWETKCIFCRFSMQLEPAEVALFQLEIEPDLVGDLGTAFAGT
jgi:hypothetical protein